MGTDYPNCVNFIKFMLRKLAVKCWLFCVVFLGKYPRNEQSKSLAYINVYWMILKVEIGNNGSMI